MPVRSMFAMSLLAVLLSMGAAAYASNGATDQQVASIIEARKKSPDEAKSILSRLSERQKEDLVREQAAIDEVLQTSPDPANLSAEDKNRLWNATKAIDAIIANNSRIADEQLICRRERKVGTQLATQTCRTKAELERDREQANRDMQSIQGGKVR